MVQRRLVKKKITRDELNSLVDQAVTSDPWRILRLPGTLHGSTGLSAIPIQDKFEKKTIEDIYRKAAVFPSEVYEEVFNLDV